MTLQVGMIASDGILIASDKCMTELSSARSTSLMSKIIHLREFKTFYCFSGDDCAWLAGQDFQKKLRAGFNFDDTIQELQSIGNVRWQTEKNEFESKSRRWVEDADRRLTIAFYGRNPAELWHLKIAKQSQAIPIFDKRISGDLSNTAVFFSERYFRNQNRLNLTALKKLAAHVILMGHELNQPSVDGLEIMTFRYGDELAQSATETELAELQEFSLTLDSYIQSRLT
jgi:hypothetical protein